MTIAQGASVLFIDQAATTVFPHNCREEDGKDKHLAGAAAQGIKDKDQKIKSQPLISVT